MALDECRTSLMMAFRYLDRALFKMPLEPAPVNAALATDGKTLYFNPSTVLTRYRTNPNELARDYLHAILHCIFRHPFTTERADPRAWSDACDVAVECIALEMCGTRFASPGDDRRRAIAEMLQEQLDTVVPAKLYRAVRESAPDGLLAFNAPNSVKSHESIKGEDVATPMGNARLFSRDSHEAWDLRKEKTPDDEADEDSDARENPDEEPEQPDTRPEEDDQGDEDGMPAEDELDEDEWEEIAKSIETDLQTLSTEQGNEAGSLVDVLSLANRRKVDYAEFLRCFATMSEDLHANPEEFDYIFYTYGLEHYGNMPLVEPLEYFERRRLREFVIALDTSGSCSGELVRMFVTRTYDILKDSELFRDRVIVHIIQCDARVQSDTAIADRTDFERFAENLQVTGGGGTDFRPVFDYVGTLLDKGEFDNLRGLIYFTDGFGTYPETPPPYETAFVFVEEDGKMRTVPPWAMKVVIDQDQILTH